MNIKCLMALLIVPITFLSCSSSGDGGGELPQQPDPDTPPAARKEIKISTAVNALMTRATDTGFDANDRVGLFVVNCGDGNTGNELKSSGNHVDNMRFKYNGTWTSDSHVYWKDDVTHADFYLYYPYRANIGDVRAMPFSVNADQSTENKYKESELLIGSTKNVAPTERSVNVNVSHALSQIMITVAAGNGFTAESLAASDVRVTVNGLKTSATVDIATAAVNATGEPQSIKPWLNGGAYKALVVPQTVAETNLITVSVDGRDYNLNKDFTFAGGKSHKFTVTVSKTSNGINVGITQWDTDGVDHGGVAE